MDSLDRRLLERLQADFPLVPSPFAALAAELGLTEEDMLGRVRSLHERGLVRRIGPVVDPRSVGRVGILAAMAVPPERLEEVAAIVSARPQVSHNYLREADHGHCPYNLWFTVSAASREEVEATVASIAADAALPVATLPSRATFKIGVRFSFPDDDDG